MANASGEALASTPALAVIAPDRQGPLSQYRSLSAVVRGWKSVFCVLVGETLCVYSSHDAQAPDMLVALQGARVMLSNDATDFAAAKEEKEAQKYPHSFFIDTAGRQQLWLAAETDQDARAWTTALKSAATKHSYSITVGEAGREVPTVTVSVPCAFCCERCENAAIAALNRVLGISGPPSRGGGDAASAGPSSEALGSASGWQYNVDHSKEQVILLQTGGASQSDGSAAAAAAAASSDTDVPHQVVQALRDVGFFANIIA